MIKIDNLSYKFREGNIGLSNINVEFNRGEVVMINTSFCYCKLNKISR